MSFWIPAATAVANIGSSIIGSRATRRAAADASDSLQSDLEFQRERIDFEREMHEQLMQEREEARRAQLMTSLIGSVTSAPPQPSGGNSPLFLLVIVVVAVAFMMSND